MYAGSGDGDYYPEQQIYGQAIVAVKQNPDTKALELKDWYAPSNAFWLRKRDLDMNVTGPVFDYKGKDTPSSRARSAGSGCSTRARWAARIIARRSTARRSSATRKCSSRAAGIWGALSTWEDADGTRWVLMPFWGPKHSQFNAPIEHGEVVAGRHRRVQDGGQAREGAAHARLALAQHARRPSRR